MDAQTTLTLRCTACGALAQASCNCGAPYKYISPGELAAKAVRENPEKSDRAIAAELGIDNSTVSKARKATVGNPTVDKRTGRDGKTRRMPKKRKNSRAQEAAAAKAVLDDASTLTQAASAVGLNSVQGVKTGIAHEEGRREMLDSLLDAAAAKNFSDKGKVKIEDAIRIHKVRLDKLFEQRVNEEVRRRIEVAADATRAENKRLRQENMSLMTLLAKQRIMTVDEFKLVVSCLHPDSRENVTEQRLDRAFKIMRPKKFALTGEKDDNA